MLLQGFEGMFNQVLKQYDIFLAERVEDLNEQTISMDFRVFGSPEEMAAITSGDNFPDFQCTVKSDACHSNKCEVDLAYKSLLTGTEHQTIIIQEKNSLIYILEDLISSIIFPGLIGFDYADFSRMLSNSSNIIAHCTFADDYNQDRKLFESNKDDKHNIVVLFSFSNRNTNISIEKVSHWSTLNCDEHFFEIVFYSCILRNRGHEPDRRSIFIGRDIGGNDGHL